MCPPPTWPDYPTSASPRSARKLLNAIILDATSREAGDPRWTNVKTAASSCKADSDHDNTHDDATMADRYQDVENAHDTMVGNPPADYDFCIHEMTHDVGVPPKKKKKKKKKEGKQAKKPGGNK